MPSSSSLLFGDDALPRVDRLAEILALLLVDERDAHESARRWFGDATLLARLSSAVTRSSHRA